jgi:2'-hydroxyisoflavone reductase
VGRHLVEAALARGDDVTIFTRGRSNPNLFPEARRLTGDRDGDLSALEEGAWDAAVDTSGYFPRVVRASTELLADRVGHLTFVSSGSVYADHSRPGTDESAPVHELAPGAAEELGSPQAYGGFKALCERAAEAAMPGRVLTVRAGLVVGRHDPTNRFTYWVARIARGGEVLAPEPRTQPVQILDVRDLSEWILRMADEGRGGVFNAAGPERPLTLEGTLVRIRDGLGADAAFTWVEERFLVDAGVEPFQDLPLWLAPTVEPDWAGFLALDASRAVATGLRFRPLDETARWILDWARNAEPPPKTAGVAMAPAGLTPEREADLLAAWHGREAA